MAGADRDPFTGVHQLEDFQPMAISCVVRR
jgi:hypothetical protein